uniref:GIR1-like zinc ribbon domain-containing protein n=1 Tax=Cucumis melo TaxID=3656 RepID=A0A9I9EM26_CUCME
MGQSFNNSKSESISQDLSLAISNSTIEDPSTVTMVLLGCTRCLMYIMSSKLDLKCPKCNNTTLLDIFNLTNQVSRGNFVDMSPDVTK